MSLDIRRHRWSDPVLQELIAELSAEMAAIYPEDSRHGLFGHDVDEERTRFLIGWEGESPLACGGLVPLEEGVCELKSLYVCDAARGRGIGSRLLGQLEREARAADYRTLRLETGSEQTAAIALYEGSGYRRIPPYGRYASGPFSICFEKNLCH